MPKGRPRSCALDETVFDQITPTSARWIGFLFADGSILDDRLGARRLAVNLAERDRDHLEKLRSFLGSTHTIGELRHRERKIRTSTLQPSRSASFRVRSEKLVNCLEKYGMAKHKPDRVPRLGLYRSSAFWAGTVDADGSIGNTLIRGHLYAEISLCGHEPLLRAFQGFLHKKGITLQLGRTSSGIWKIHTTGRHARQLIELFYTDESAISAGLQRKVERAHAILRNEPAAAY